MEDTQSIGGIDIAALALQHEKPLDLEIPSDHSLIYIHTKSTYLSIGSSIELTQQAIDIFMDDVPVEILCEMAYYGRDVYFALLGIPKFALYVQKPHIQEHFRKFYTRVVTITRPLETITQYQCGSWLHRHFNEGPARVTIIDNEPWMAQYKITITEYFHANQFHRIDQPAVTIQLSHVPDIYQEYWNHGVLYSISTSKDITIQKLFSQCRISSAKSLLELVSNNNYMTTPGSSYIEGRLGMYAPYNGIENQYELLA